MQAFALTVGHRYKARRNYDHGPGQHSSVSVLSTYIRRLCLDVELATSGQSRIDCFDAWAKELVETGYLHNHARMWFASIWIFTLRLP